MIFGKKVFEDIIGSGDKGRLGGGVREREGGCSMRRGEKDAGFCGGGEKALERGGTLGAVGTGGEGRCCCSRDVRWVCAGKRKQEEYTWKGKCSVHPGKWG